MSGNRPVNSNRQRNLSLTSNTSSSSYKDNASNNQKTPESQVFSRSGMFNSSLTNANSASPSARDVQHGSLNRSSSSIPQLNPLQREFQRPRFESYEAMSSASLNSTMDHGNLACEPEHEIQQKLTEMQQKKLQYENVLLQLQQLQTSLNNSPQIPATSRGQQPVEQRNIETAYAPVNLRSSKLQEAQQRLTQLQDLMQNVSLDLDCNPFARQHKNKNIYPHPTLIKEYPDFLLNVGANENGSVHSNNTRASAPPMNPDSSRYRNIENSFEPHRSYSPQQNNLSLESITPKIQRNSQMFNHGHGSLLDVFVRSDEASLNSSEGSAPEIDDNLMNDANEDADQRDERIPQAEQSNRHQHMQVNCNCHLSDHSHAANSIPQISQDRLDHMEQQIERTNSLCELVAVEQRRMALLMENLLATVSNLQPVGQHNNPRFINGRPNPLLVPLSSLPLNCSWNDTNVGTHHGGGGSDTHVLAQAINQCCHLLTQLQRDLSAVQQSVETTSLQSQEPAVQAGASSSAIRSPEVHHQGHHRPSHFNETRTLRKKKVIEARTTTSSYETNEGVDRFDLNPAMTLNNRVPPGTRTNNYWDNFRSYSRQNLLSSGSSASASKFSSQAAPGDQILLHAETTASTTTAATATATATMTMTGNHTRDTHSTNPPRRSDPPRRTKRKVNKGQRQVEIGVVRSPHADNRALAGTYGLMSVVSGGGGAAASVAHPEANIMLVARNLNATSSSSNGNDAHVLTTIAEPAAAAVSVEIVKNNSTLKYSGARPKEERGGRPAEASALDANVNLMVDREMAHQSSSQHNHHRQPLELIVREHAGCPQFLANLLELLHKFDNDDLRQMALNALQGVADSRQSQFLTVFNAVAANQREFTPNLLDSFLVALRQQTANDHDPLEGAAAALPPSQDEQLLHIRHALAPFLFRRLSQVHDLIGDTLLKLESKNSSAGQNEASVSATAAAAAASPVMASGQEDDLAEADQSCDGANLVDSLPLVDHSPAGAAAALASGAGEWNEETELTVRRSVGGLDEVPTRLLSILNPPVWSRPHSSVSQSSPIPTTEDGPSLNRSNVSMRKRQEPECSNSAWFPEDDSV